MTQLCGKEKILVIGVIDEILMSALGSKEQFTEEEREEVTQMFQEVFDQTAPADLRETLFETARILYDEVKEEMAEMAEEENE